MSTTCNECGSELVADILVDSDGMLDIGIDPCPICMDGTNEVGFDAGRDSMQEEMNAEIDDIVTEKVKEALHANGLLKER